MIQVDQHLEYLDDSQFVGAPRDDSVLREVLKYQLWEYDDLESDSPELCEYVEFLERSLKPLGLWQPKFLPSQNSRCFKLTFSDRLVAIFRLTHPHPDADLLRILKANVDPGLTADKVLEVNNVAVDPRFQGELLLGIILRACATTSHAAGAALVAGVIRVEALAFFADFGTIPVYHEPLHLLGDEGINDYVTYFDTSNDASVAYARARAYHYFHRKVIMRRLTSAPVTNGATVSESATVGQR